MGEKLIYDFALPLLTLLIGWLTSAYRNKQKKEHDILDNVTQIVDMQKAYIEQCKKRMAEYEAAYRRLEAKYDHKVRAVKEAYDCEHDTSNCPVLIYDKSNNICDTCELKKSNEQ